MNLFLYSRLLVTTTFFLATRNGMAICFNENDARAVGRTASGVKAIDLADGDYVVGAEPVREDKQGSFL